MKRPFLFMLMLVAGIGMSRAQTDDTPIPKPPFIMPVPDYAHWMVTLSYGGSGENSAPESAPEGFPTVIDTIKTGDLRGVVLTFGDKSTHEYTCQGNWIVNSTPKGPELGIVSPARPPYRFYTPGFVLLDGLTITASTYKEVQKHQGTPAFHYKSADADIWIDIKSMLPLAVKRSGIEADFQFLAPPPRPFLIPKEQADLLQKEQDAYDKVRSMR